METSYEAVPEEDESDQDVATKKYADNIGIGSIFPFSEDQSVGGYKITDLGNGINPGDAANIRSRNDLIRAIAYKMLEKQGEPVDVDILASIELMIETDPILRDFIDRSFDS